MKRIAFFTYSEMRFPITETCNQDFIDMHEDIVESIYKADGLIDQADVEEWQQNVSDWEQDWKKWGRYVAPRFYEGSKTDGDETIAQTLTVWRDIESAAIFTYKGSHARALKNRNKWFERSRFPNYVMWWIDEGETPTWKDGCTKLEKLHDNGSTQKAFDFKKAFNCDGQAIDLDLRALKAIALTC